MTNVPLLDRMAFATTMLPEQVRAIIRSAPLRYKKFLIPKKNGGSRRVAQPAREVKLLQYFILAEISSILPIHAAAFAYREGLSIRGNAQTHLDSRYLLKMDFERFFPSIKRKDVALHLQNFCRDHYSDEEIGLICNIVLWAPERSKPLELCIGAPSSPLISNSIMFEFDNIIANVLNHRSVNYTRYADDLTFSSRSRDQLVDVEDLVKNALQSLTYPSIKVNSKKTVHCSMATRREVTGIVLTPEHKLSVGRDRKRLARSMYYRAQREELDSEAMQKLNGLLAFIESVEPGFSARLSESYRRSLNGG
ncbi:retron St85 family RNA-directed DNA polymerase [Pinirhizobacter soli]|uniref:retron St85 family RNA-directed DNA polymerase n=1 Tax=Pinirhizobacter soli TaxID=2786953 RepID=UPI00202A44AD|nr:retron St85 family RNA-directed DNA polymerase [Pinirhizobacter soli]